MGKFDTRLPGRPPRAMLCCAWRAPQPQLRPIQRFQGHFPHCPLHIVLPAAAPTTALSPNHLLPTARLPCSPCYAAAHLIGAAQMPQSQQGAAASTGKGRLGVVLSAVLLLIAVYALYLLPTMGKLMHSYDSLGRAGGGEAGRAGGLLCRCSGAARLHCLGLY